MAEKRKRGQNFTVEEKDRLIKLLLDHKETILNKKTDGSTNEAKSLAWSAVTNSFNTEGRIFRSKDSLMKMWDKLKSESKVYYTPSRRDASQTGGGPSSIKYDPILEQVCSILGRGCTGIIGVPDSDSIKETVIEMPSKIICLDDSKNLAPNAINFEIQEMKSNKNIDEDDIRKTPLWSRRRPLWSRRRPPLHQPNERTEAVCTLCNSFKEVNKRKETIEELRQQLLEDEINFKRKLYDLQLQTAAKELEIKNEILLQVKAGVASRPSNPEAYL